MDDEGYMSIRKRMKSLKWVKHERYASNIGKLWERKHLILTYHKGWLSYLLSPVEEIYFSLCVMPKYVLNISLKYLY